MRRLLAASVLLLATAAPSWAVPFDLILPSAITINLNRPYFVGSVRIDPVLIARDEPIDFARNGTSHVPREFVSFTTFDLDAVKRTRLTVFPSGAGLAPHEILITAPRVFPGDPFGAYLAQYGSLFLPGETAVDIEESGLSLISVVSEPAFPREFRVGTFSGRMDLRDDEIDAAFLQHHRHLRPVSAS